MCLSQVVEENIAVKQKDNDIKGKKTTEKKEEKDIDAMVCLCF